VKLGWFDWEEKKYKTAVELKEQVELLSMIGDVALKDGEGISPDTVAPTEICGDRFPFEKTTPTISALTTPSGEMPDRRCMRMWWWVEETARHTAASASPRRRARGRRAG
jgi:hypothetical protein